MAMGRVATPSNGEGTDFAPVAEINMTPFIDVMLVLLIIFMVTAPLMTTGVPLDLPKTGAAQVNVDSKPLSLDINAKGQLFFDGKELPDADILPKLASVAKQGFEERILIRGDKSVDYGRVLQIMTVISQAGYKRTVMVTQPAQ